MATKVLWAAALLAYGASTGAAMNSGRGASISSTPLPLDMAPNSVDDMYHGCDVEMEKEVKNKYLKNEMNTNTFKKVWDESVKWYNGRRLKPRRTGDWAVAIYAYSSASGSLYLPFNEAVRTQGPQYTTNFRFHALHYYLTKAVQKLQKTNECLTVYRRTKESFSQDVVDTEVRFGSFASSSRIKLKNPTPTIAEFGDKSCFKIKTCLGADISKYSKYESEAEVLIPPYEVFKVTGVEKKSEQKDLPCEVVYTLESTGQPVSNFNCALFPELRNTNRV